MLLQRETSLVPCSRSHPGQPRAWFFLLLLLLTSHALAAAPAKLDLDTFDALKKTVTLANGQSLAYVPLGDPAGAPVLLIHGFTDSARDWVPLVPYLAPQLAPHSR